MFSLLSNKKGKSKSMFFSLISLLCIFLLSGCRDSLLDTKTFDEPVSTDLTHVNSRLKNQFFKIPDDIRPEFKEILLSIQVQDQANQFVTQEWVAQNGIPIWDKIFSPTAGGNESSLGTRSSRTVKDMSFIPLKDTITQEIKSFIAVYKLEGNTYGYRFYNKQALLNFFPPNNDVKTKIISTLTVFGFFEENINGKKKLKLPAPYNKTIEGVKIKITKADNNLTARQSCSEICFHWTAVSDIALMQEIGRACFTICSYDGPITDISDYGGGSSCSLCGGGLGSTGSSTGGGSPSSSFTALDGLIYNGSFLATLNAALEPGGITEHDFAMQYPEYVTLLHNLKALNQYLTNFDNTDLEFFARNPESIIPLTTFFAQGGSISDGVQHKNLLKENADYLAANKQAGFPTVGSENWEKNVAVPFLGPELVVQYSVWCVILKDQNSKRPVNERWSNARIRAQAFWNTTKELIHTGLDIAGLVPGFGEFFDGANGIFYTIEGDGLNATLSFAAAIPIAGWVATGSKYAIKTIGKSGRTYHLNYKVVNGIIEFGDKDALRSQLRRILNLSPGDGFIAHHIIPLAQADKPLAQAAAKFKAAFHPNEFNNGIAITSAVHTGSHQAYSDLVVRRMNEIYIASGGINITPQKAHEEIQNLMNRIRIAIQNNPNTDLDNLFF